MTMTENLTHILVFRTNIHTEATSSAYWSYYPATPWWRIGSVDMDDVDRTRVVSHELSPEDVAQLLGTIGYQCQELE